MKEEEIHDSSHEFDLGIDMSDCSRFTVLAIMILAAITAVIGWVIDCLKSVRRVNQ